MKRRTDIHTRPGNPCLEIPTTLPCSLGPRSLEGSAGKSPLKARLFFFRMAPLSPFFICVPQGFSAACSDGPTVKVLLKGMPFFFSSCWRSTVRGCFRGPLFFPFRRLLQDIPNLHGNPVVGTALSKPAPFFFLLCPPYSCLDVGKSFAFLS